MDVRQARYKLRYRGSPLHDVYGFINSSRFEFGRYVTEIDTLGHVSYAS